MRWSQSTLSPPQHKIEALSFPPGKSPWENRVASADLIGKPWHFVTLDSPHVQPFILSATPSSSSSFPPLSPRWCKTAFTAEGRKKERKRKRKTFFYFLFPATTPLSICRPPALFLKFHESACWGPRKGHWVQPMHSFFDKNLSENICT